MSTRALPRDHGSIDSELGHSAQGCSRATGPCDQSGGSGSASMAVAAGIVTGTARRAEARRSISSARISRRMMSSSSVCSVTQPRMKSAESVVSTTGTEASAPGTGSSAPGTEGWSTTSGAAAESVSVPPRRAGRGKHPSRMKGQPSGCPRRTASRWVYCRAGSYVFRVHCIPLVEGVNRLV